MAARTPRAKKAAATVPVPPTIVEETGTMATDDVYEGDDAQESESTGAKRGRKPDPVKAAVARFSSARTQLEQLRKLPTVEEAEKEYAEAKDALSALMEDL